MKCVIIILKKTLNYRCNKPYWEILIEALITLVGISIKLIFEFIQSPKGAPIQPETKNANFLTARFANSFQYFWPFHAELLKLRI